MSNKQYKRFLKGIYIRDVKNDPYFRSSVGYFKSLAKEKKLLQQELFVKLMNLWYNVNEKGK